MKSQTFRNPEEGSGGDYPLPTRFPIARNLLRAELSRAERNHYCIPVPGKETTCEGCQYAEALLAELKALD